MRQTRRDAVISCSAPYLSQGARSGFGVDPQVLSDLVQEKSPDEIIRSKERHRVDALTF